MNSDRPSPDRPPSPLERLVERMLGARPSTRFVIGDLREEYALVRGRRSAAYAACWYLTQGARLALRVRWASRMHGAPSESHGRTGLAGGPFDTVGTDFRQSIRMLARQPGVTAAVVATVAISIAVTTGAFAVVDGVLLEPLPYDAPERLVAVWEQNPRGESRNVVSSANYLAWQEGLDSFEALASLMESSTTLESDGAPERVGFVRATAEYFRVVGAEPMVGRLFDEDDDVEGAAGVAVLSEDYWRRRFGADRSVLGETLRLGVGSYTVIGVLPDRYDFETSIAFGGIGSRDVWLPARFEAADREAGGRYLHVIGRLAPRASLSDARSEASALAAELSAAHPERNSGWGVNVVPLQRDLVGDARSTILIVFAAVCLVLLIACANVANLLMTRATQRREEMAVRAALGAGRGRIVKQLLVESAVMSGAGGVFGLVLADRGLTALLATAPDIPRLEAVGIDWTVAGWAVLATAATALLFGLAPAFTIRGRHPAGSLAARGATGGIRLRGLRGGLVVVQVALSLVLLVGAGLLTRSLLNRFEAGVGFEVDNVLMADIQLGGRDERERALFWEELVPRAGAIPGVEAASAVTWPPLAGGGSRTSFWPLDRPPPPAAERPGADVRPVHREYHRVMGIPLLSGRRLGPQDGADGSRVLLVNATGAARTWPGEDPVGKRIALSWGDTLVAEVVGVVGDVGHEGPDTDPYPMFYFDQRQFSPFDLMSLVLRTIPEADRDAVMSAVRSVLSDMDPSIPAYNVSSMEALFADALKRPRLATLSLGVFAILALVLAQLGIYGVVAQGTAERVREIGIRMALGAERWTIVRMVVGQGMVYVGAAIGVGVVAALAFSRVLRGLVFGVDSTDPATFVVMVLLLGTTGLIACWLPARRAAAVDPAQTIRKD